MNKTYQDWYNDVKNLSEEEIIENLMDSLPQHVHNSSHRKNLISSLYCTFRYFKDKYDLIENWEDLYKYGQKITLSVDEIDRSILSNIIPKMRHMTDDENKPWDEMIKNLNSKPLNIK